MLNLLIALLSTTYSRLADQGAGLYLHHIIEELPRWAFDSRLNLFSYRNPPLIVLTLFALPCLVSVKLRDLIEKLNYLPAYLVGLALVLAVDLLSFPFAWARVIKRGCFRGEAGSILFGAFVFPFVASLMCALDLGMASYKLWDSSSFKAFQKNNQEDNAKQMIS